MDDFDILKFTDDDFLYQQSGCYENKIQKIIFRSYDY